MSRQLIIDRERRWALPVAAAAIAAAILAIVSLPIQRGAFDGTGPAEQLRSVDAHSGSVVLASVLTAIALVLMIAPLLYLFTSARARSDQMRGAFIGFVFIGPLLFAAQYVASGLATTSLASDFVAQQGELRSGPPLGAFANQVHTRPQSFDQITFYPDENALDATLDDGTIYSLRYPAGGTSCAILQERSTGCEQALRDAVRRAGITTDEDTDGRPGDDLAQELGDDSSARQVAANLLLPALIGLITAVVYSCLHAMRVGLLTRFMGTLGMALGVSVVLVALFPLLLYMVALGLLFVGRLPGGRPPAWEAGRAVPWPPPGEPAPADRPADPGAIEGEATEVGTGDGAGNVARRERARKRKRKRRR